MNFLQRLSEGFFRIREFEKDGKVYERLGVRHVSKFFGNETIGRTKIPNPLHNPAGQGSRTMRMFLKNPTFDQAWARKKDSLRQAELALRGVELGHLGLGVLFLPAIFSSPLVVGGFVAGNVYLAITHRYNRARINNLIENKRFKS